MCKFKRALFAFLIFSSNALSIESYAQTNKTNCSFNGRSEACTVQSEVNRDEYDLAVTWLSNGKKSFYYFHKGNTAVRITDFTGREKLLITSGSWYRDGRNLIVNSSRGNKIVIPW